MLRLVMAPVVKTAGSLGSLAELIYVKLIDISLTETFVCQKRHITLVKHDRLAPQLR